MGVLLSMCGNGEHVDTPDEKKIKSLTRQLELKQETNEQQRDIIQKMESRIKYLETTCDKMTLYFKVFENPDEVATYIMSTDMHIKWMDDKTEKKYIMSVLAFVKKYAEKQKQPLSKFEVMLLKPQDTESALLSSLVERVNDI